MKMDDRYNGWVRTKFWLGRCEQGAVFPQRTSKVEKKNFYQQKDRPTMQQNSFMFPESLPFFCTNKLFQFSPTVYFEERRFRASQIQQIWLILFYWKLLKRVYSITNLTSKAFIEWFDSCTCQNSRHQHNQRKISNRFLQRIL